jgi:hypothetical protein
MTRILATVEADLAEVRNSGGHQAAVVAGFLGWMLDAFDFFHHPWYPGHVPNIPRAIPTLRSRRSGLDYGLIDDRRDPWRNPIRLSLRSLGTASYGRHRDDGSAPGNSALGIFLNQARPAGRSQQRQGVTRRELQSNALLSGPIFSIQAIPGRLATLVVPAKSCRPPSRILPP